MLVMWISGKFQILVMPRIVVAKLKFLFTVYVMINVHQPFCRCLHLHIHILSQMEHRVIHKYHFPVHKTFIRAAFFVCEIGQLHERAILNQIFYPLEIRLNSQN